MASAYVRSTMLPVPPRTKKTKLSTIASNKNMAFPQSLPVLPSRSLVQMAQSRSRSRNGIMFTQQSAHNSFTSSSQQARELRSSSASSGTRQDQNYVYGSDSAVSDGSNEPSQESVNIDVPMSQLTMSQFSQQSSTQSIASIANDPELHQQSATSTSSARSSIRSSYMSKTYTNNSSRFSSKSSSIPPSSDASLLDESVNLQVDDATSGRRKARPWTNLSTYMAAATVPQKSAKGMMPRCSTPSRAETQVDTAVPSRNKTADGPGTNTPRLDTGTTALNGNSSEAKPNSLITDHFMPVEARMPGSPSDQNVKAPTEDIVAVMNEKQQVLERLSSEIDEKIRKQEHNVNEANTRAAEMHKVLEESKATLQRLNEASKEAVDTVNQTAKNGVDTVQQVTHQGVDTINQAIQRGVGTLAKATADVRDATAQAKKKILEEATHAAKRLFPSLFDKTFTKLISESESVSDRKARSHEHDDASSESSSLQTQSIDLTLVQPTSEKGASKAYKKREKRSSGEAQAPTRRSKRVKLDTNVPDAQVRTPVRNPKAFCVTPSTRRDSHAALPTSITFSRRESTRNSRPSGKSTASKRKSPAKSTNDDDAAVESRKRTKVQKLPKDVHQGSDSDSSTGSFAQSEASAKFISPSTKTARTAPAMRRAARRRRGTKARRTVETSLVDDFNFIG